MRIVISGIPIDVQKKNIKNMHLQVKPPDGHVVISSPLSVGDKAIEAYARTQLGFIKRAIAQFQDQPRASKRQYVSGETMYIWGKQYFLVFKPDNQKNSFEIQNQNIVLSMSAKSTVKQRDAYVKEEYRKILKEEIEKRLPKWEAQTGLKCDSWQTKYMVTKWGACSTDKKKLWFNLQLAQKPYACLDYIILHELTHLITRKHDATFIAHMDRYMPNWREIRKELNDSRLDYYEAQDESPLQKLIDQSRYDDIRDAAIAYIQEEHSGTAKRPSVVDMEIENVIHIEQPEDGVIAFDVIASCDVEMPSSSRKGYFNERWLKIHCQVTLGIDMSGFRIMAVGNCEPQEESDNDRLSGELVPIISRDQFDDEAEKFLTRYCPKALDSPIRIPIETIASDMKLQVIEDVPLSDDLTYFGTIIFDNGNVLDKHRKITIRNAKRGTVYLDPRVSYERSMGTKRTTLAHECFHWHRHQPYHVLMKMIGANDNLGKAIQCQIAANTTDSDKWKAVDWMEWQAKGVAPRILMPAKTTRLKADQLLAEYGGVDEASIAAYENVIDELAELFDVSRQATKVRLIDLGYSKAEGAYPFVDGQYMETVRSTVVKITYGGSGGKTLSLKEINTQINELLKASIQSQGVISLFDSKQANENISLFDPAVLDEISKMKEKNIAVEILKKLMAEQVSLYKRTNVVQSQKFSEKITQLMNSYYNGLITNEEVIKELLKTAQEITELYNNGKKLGLSQEELAFYDALTKPENIKDFYRNNELIDLTRELTEMLRKNRTIDWQKKETARASMRKMVKHLLKKYKYPPEDYDTAISTVISQCEMWTDNMTA